MHRLPPITFRIGRLEATCSAFGALIPFLFNVKQTCNNHPVPSLALSRSPGNLLRCPQLRNPATPCDLNQVVCPPCGFPWSTLIKPTGRASVVAIIFDIRLHGWHDGWATDCHATCSGFDSRMQQLFGHQNVPKYTQKLVFEDGLNS
ncbi:hypothetical protein SFRURICE_017858 [Spodoptera frugiperda]|nr:hypothetical protein SFRURICE_017858 [Spodoptera frugiperda]